MLALGIAIPVALPIHLAISKVFPTTLHQHYNYSIAFIVLVIIGIGEVCVKRLSFKMLLILGITGWIIKSFVIAPVVLYFNN